MAIILDGHATTTLKLKASDGSEVIKQLTEEGTIPTPTETLDIRANGLIDVTHFKKVNVQIEGGGELPELTNPASASDIAKDKEAIDGSGNKIIGTNTFDADTSDADAVASDIAQGKTAYVNGAKVVGTASVGATEYWKLTGGGSSSSTKQTVNITYHGTEVDKFGTGYDGYWWNINATFADAITKIKGNAFSNKAQAAMGYKLSLSAADNFSSLKTLGQECFRGTGLESVNFPEVEFLEGATGGQFAQCKLLTSLILPKFTNFAPVNGGTPRTIAYNLNNTVLTEVQIGSVGYGITSFPSGGDFAGATNASLVITFYCEGAMVDTIKTAMRTGTKGNTTATLVFKASANTTYGGQSFGAGDTILTDAPSA